jgi:hypothetical protein
MPHVKISKDESNNINYLIQKNYLILISQYCTFYLYSYYDSRLCTKIYINIVLYIYNLRYICIIHDYVVTKHNHMYVYN